MNKTQQDKIYPRAVDTQTMSVVINGQQGTAKYLRDFFLSEAVLATGQSTYSFFKGSENPENRKYHENGVLFEHGGYGLVTGLAFELLVAGRDEIDYSSSITEINKFVNSMYATVSVGDRDISRHLLKEFFPVIVGDSGVMQHNPSNPLNHDNVARFATPFMLDKDNLFKLRVDSLFSYSTNVALNTYVLRAIVYGRTITPK